MAGRQSHLVDVCRIPGRDDVAARVGIVLQTLDELGDLVDFAPIWRSPVPPLITVDRAEIV